MRISDAAWLPLLLAACSPTASESSTEAKVDNHIGCALRGSADFTHDCTVELAKQDDLTLLIVRHPDGGFRRFEIVDGGLKTADGREQAKVSIPERRKVMDVSVGRDRYRIPIHYDDPKF